MRLIRRVRLSLGQGKMRKALFLRRCGILEKVSSDMGVKEKIENLLADSVNITILQVENESHMHSVPPNSETHFKVVIVSSDFVGKRKVARHQLIYGTLSALMQQGIHALALHTYTPDEWQDKQQQSPASPDCMGGSKKV